MTYSKVAAIVLAAGLSRRMGALKLTLPWGETTVIGQVATTLSASGLREIVVVTGHRKEDVEAALSNLPVRCVFNPHYASGEMLSSIQAGFAALSTGYQAILVCLGDQPQMEAATVEAVLGEGERTTWERIIIPSYRMRAGHPILIPYTLSLQIMNATESLRTVLRANAHLVQYLVMETPRVLADLDTPEDYAQSGQANPTSTGDEPTCG